MLVVHASPLRGEAGRSPDEGDTLEYSARLNVTKQLLNTSIAICKYTNYTPHPHS